MLRASFACSVPTERRVLKYIFYTKENTKPYRSISLDVSVLKTMGKLMDIMSHLHLLTKININYVEIYCHLLWSVILWRTNMSMT